MNEQIDKELKDAFKGWVEYVVIKCHKKGILSKARTRWSLVKYWNDSRYSEGGIPGQIKYTLGEKLSTSYFQEVSEETLNDQAFLNKALVERDKENKK